MAPSLTTSTSPALRTGIQAALAEGSIRLLEVVPSPDLMIAPADRALILVVLTAVYSFLQNWVEGRVGAKLLAPTTDPAPEPPEPVEYDELGEAPPLAAGPLPPVEPEGHE